MSGGAYAFVRHCRSAGQTPTKTVFPVRWSRLVAVGTCLWFQALGLQVPVAWPYPKAGIGYLPRDRLEGCAALREEARSLVARGLDPRLHHGAKLHEDPEMGASFGAVFVR